ncbi:MAG: hypothetical protein NC305_09230 [Lachnospiraceae bacterium]|nr:hypothetical protein [Butyrivibrio sp.]MCM1342986.1 hypothetical protein [Muribaculaceae bacterium]MCM1410716.1 hypothetical protein [Lachnospiraceae bacterium]
MFRVFQEEKIVTACMFTLLAVSILLRIVQGLLYQNMIKESDNMASTENKMLKQCKLKFANCYQMSNGVANIPVFVDKFLNRMKWGPFTFETLYHLSGQAMLLSVVSAGAGVYRSIMAGRTLGDILPFYIVSFFGLYLYFSISTVVDVKKKKRVLKVNLVDYLENHLSPRIDITRQDIEMLYGDTGTEGRTVSGRVSAGGRNRSRQGRRTVELMPIGIRQPADRLTLDEARNIEMENRPGSPMEETIKPDAASQDSAAVTEEELEALLKEFLAN